MPLPFGLTQRPTLPSLASWASPRLDDKEPATPTPHSAPPAPRASVSSTAASTTSSLAKRLSGRSFRQTPLAVSRQSAASAISPLSATFGLPVEEDDDPFGVRALEAAGLQIKEAGTKDAHRPGSDAFQYRPSPNSPIWRSSMASAMSKNSRPSLDGRASIVNGRPSFAHSRQSSVSEMGTQTVMDGDSTGLDNASNVNATTRTPREARPEEPRKISPPRVRSKFGERPPPLKLVQSGDKWKSDESSPRSRLSAVQEKVREIEIEQRARAQREKEEKENSPPVESDLDKLAREIKEMAYEHDEQQRRSEEAERDSEDVKVRQDVNLVSEGTQMEKPTEPQNETKANTSPEVTAAISGQSAKLTRAASKRKSKRKSMQVPELTTTSADDDMEVFRGVHAKPLQEDEFEDEDDDDEDYDSFDEEPVIIEAAVQAAAPASYRPRNMGIQSLQARAQVVSIHMPPPPAIPSRNPRRSRNAEARDDGTTTPTSPRSIQEEPSTPAQAIAHTASTASRPESIRSARDNDSSSSYSLGQRDSFAETNQDLMSQTSHGSDVSDPIDTTPTKSKLDGSDLPKAVVENHDRTPGQDGQDTTEVTDLTTGVRKSLVENVEPTLEAKNEPEAPKSEPAQTASKELETPKQSEQKPLAPVVPERRRPFSFEAQADVDELSSAPTIDSAMDVSAPPAPVAKHAIEQTENEPSKTDVQPIVIPELPDDDESVYEEDFS